MYNIYEGQHFDLTKALLDEISEQDKENVGPRITQNTISQFNYWDAKMDTEYEKLR